MRGIGPRPVLSRPSVTSLVLPVITSKLGYGRSILKRFHKFQDEGFAGSLRTNKHGQISKDDLRPSYPRKVFYDEGFHGLSSLKDL